MLCILRPYTVHIKFFTLYLALNASIPLVPGQAGDNGVSLPKRGFKVFASQVESAVWGRRFGGFVNGPEPGPISRVLAKT